MLLQKLKAGVKNSVDVEYPGTKQKIRIRILSDSEEQQAELAAERFFIDNKIPVAMHNIDAFEAEKTTRKLFAAMTDLDGSPVSRTIEDFKEAITRMERDILVDAYNALAEECSPNPQTMTDEDLEILVDRIKKKPQDTVSNISSLSTLRALCVSLADRQQTSPMGSGSTT